MKEQSIFDFSKEGDVYLEDLFQAYFDCRKNKRNTLDALEFELDFEREVIKLWKEINDGSYEVSPLDVFIVEKPVKREIFAAKFRDRVVHHFVINKLNGIFEKEFIYDSYSCRKGKGTHFGIKRLKRSIRRCSRNYSRDCWILKVDVKGYFMHIDKNILFQRLEKLVRGKYKEKDKEIMLSLCRKIIYNDPRKECLRKSPKGKWKGLPRSKSLFFAPHQCGLPVGNYTNQVFANLYLSSLDHFMKRELKMRYYGRYVDDIVIISRDKKRLKECVPKIKEFLLSELNLTLHPKKIYLQHCRNGVEFLGVFIKPWRSYISSRVKNNSWEAIETINVALRRGSLDKQKKENILSLINSYLGIMSHANTYHLKKNF